METLVEQRRDTRTNLSWPVSIWLPEANRFFNGRSANISKTGVFVCVPMTTPVRTGHLVEVNFPRTTALAKEKGGFARIKSGKVVRVERKSMLKNGNIGVAIQFQQSNQPLLSASHKAGIIRTWGILGVNLRIKRASFRTKCASLFANALNFRANAQVFEPFAQVGLQKFAKMSKSCTK